MKRIRTAREFYCEMLKSFYFGVYRKGDSLMTYQETREAYGLSKDTIGRAYAMLRRDGFIHTDGANGTIVTFDINNSAHVEKVPLERPGSEPEDNIPYEVAMRLHAHSLYIGLTRSSETQMQTYAEIVKDILKRVKSGDTYHEQVSAFWMCIISSLDNEFMSSLVDHFISRYLYLLPPTHLSTEQRRLIGASAREYYEFLLDAVERRSFEEFPARFERHYHNYFRYGGVVLAKLEDGEIFKEQALYGKLLEEICIRIMAGKLHKGDALPTTKHLCAEYGISLTTVKRAYGILMDMGLISRHARTGTKLIAEPSDPDVWEALEAASGLQARDLKDVVEAFAIINNALGNRITITPDVAQQMRTELARQYHLYECYATPFFVSAVLLSPLVASLPASILHKYYAQLTNIMERAITLCTFRVHMSRKHVEEIYQLMCDAIEKLEQGDQPSFANLSERVMFRNAELLNEDYIRSPREIGTVKSSNQPVKEDRSIPKD